MALLVAAKNILGYSSWVMSRSGILSKYNVTVEQSICIPENCIISFQSFASMEKWKDKPRKHENGQLFSFSFLIPHCLQHSSRPLLPLWVNFHFEVTLFGPRRPIYHSSRPQKPSGLIHSDFHEVYCGCVLSSMYTLTGFGLLFSICSHSHISVYIWRKDLCLTLYAQAYLFVRSLKDTSCIMWFKDSRWSIMKGLVFPDNNPWGQQVAKCSLTL